MAISKREQKPREDWGGSKEKPSARTGALFERKHEMAIYSLLHRRDAMAILSTGFGNSMIVTVFVMGKEEMSLSKTCMIAISPLKKYYRRPDFGNIVAELYSNGICFKEVHLNFFCYSVLENNALHRKVDETHTVEERRSA